jgi:UDP-GlcNAc:undecaprenyl-phosphate/decaprenyl-phosphate GlcNAc-1-phosphate transferase
MTILSPVLFAFLSFIIAVLILPLIIKFAHKRALFDEPLSARKVHKVSTPNFGGVAIAFTTLLIAGFFLTGKSSLMLNCLLAGAAIIFLLGLMDDILNLQPVKKLLVQLLVSLAVVLVADLRITDLHGVFGITTIGFPASVAISVAFIVLITNAYNLIDGIDWLAGSLSLIAFAIFAIYFQLTGATSLLTLAIILIGAIAAFLLFNRTPARIFMGDSGSLFIGFILAIFSIQAAEAGRLFNLKFSPVSNELIHAACGILIVPVFDTCRLFVLRLSKGKSPFSADRNHLHHKLLDLGLTHLQSSFTICILSISCISLSIFLENISISWVILSLVVSCALFSGAVSFMSSRAFTDLRTNRGRRNRKKLA